MSYAYGQRPRLPPRLAAGNSLRMNSGAYAPVFSTLALNKTKMPPRMGRHFCLLRRDGKVKKPMPIHVSLHNVLYNQDLMTTPPLTIQGGKMSVFLPIRGNSRTRCEPHQKWLTKCQKKEFRKRKKETRAEHYIRLLERHDWSRAELARYLGVSRAWVTTVLNNLDN